MADQPDRLVSCGEGAHDLTRWRLELGAHRLTASEQTIATIADAVGYGSDAAFALAFKRELGTPPGRYRREARRHDTTSHH